MARPRGDIAPRIVHAARTRFLTEGVDGASLRRIAEDAGTNIGMIYYYFPSKDDLFLAVVEEIYVALLVDLEAALAPALPVDERILRLYQRLGQLSADELLVLRIVVREVLASPARLARLIDRFRRGHLPLVFRLLRDGFAGGSFDPALSPALVMIAMMVLGGPAQLILQRIDRKLAGAAGAPAPPTGAELAEALLRVLLAGTAPRGDKPARGAGKTAPKPRRQARGPAKRR